MEEAPAQCRYCLQEVLPGLAGVLKPCCCAGTMAYVHSSCLLAWQLQKPQGEVDHCEVCGQHYVLPPHTLSAADSFRLHVWRPVAVAARKARRWTCIGVILTRAAVSLSVRLLSAADYARAAAEMVPAVLDAPATLSPYLLEWALAGVTIALTAAVERRLIRALRRGVEQQQQQQQQQQQPLVWVPPVPVQQQVAQQRRQPGGLAADVSWAFWRSSAIAAGALLGATAFGRLANAPSLPLLSRRLAALVGKAFVVTFGAAFPCAAALTGASVAVWRVKLAFLRPLHSVAQLQGAGRRVGRSLGLLLLPRATGTQPPAVAPTAALAAAGALAVGQQGRGASSALPGQCGEEQRGLWSSLLLAALVVVLT